MRLRPAEGRDMQLIAALRADIALQHLLMANPCPDAGAGPGQDPEAAARDWVARRESAGFFRIIALVADDAAGFVQISDIHRKNCFGWLGVALRPQDRGQGFGAAALAATEDAARAELGLRKLLLQVRSDNGAAIRLYQRGNWRRVGRLEAHYDDGCSLHDVLIYEKRLVAK